MTRYESTKKVGFYGIIGNIFLLIIKFSVAFISHSQALIADAINSAGDIFSSLMTYIGNKIACTPSDDNHNFGHGKAEYIFSMLISVFMLFIASKILLDSFVSIITKKEFIFSYYLILVCIITILVKLTLYLYCKKLYKKHSNILINASMKDHRNDILLTMGTLTSIILGSFGYYFFDVIFGAVISIYIMLSGIGIFLESYKILMDVSLDSNAKEEIIKYCNSLNLDNIGFIKCRRFDELENFYKNRKENNLENEFEESDIEKRINPMWYMKEGKTIISIAFPYLWIENNIENGFSKYYQINVNKPEAAIMGMNIGHFLMLLFLGLGLVATLLLLLLILRKRKDKNNQVPQQPVAPTPVIDFKPEFNFGSRNGTDDDVVYPGGTLNQGSQIGTVAKEPKQLVEEARYEDLTDEDYEDITRNFDYFDQTITKDELIAAIREGIETKNTDKLKMLLKQDELNQLKKEIKRKEMAKRRSDRYDDF